MTTGEPPTGTESAAAPDAVEQVQRLVLTLIGAARVALDALEAVVSDRSRLDELAASGRDIVGGLVHAVTGGAGPEPTSGGEGPTGDR
jgi:hypothetical protein